MARKKGWHEGTPTEKGWYVVAYRVRDCDGTHFWEYEARWFDPSSGFDPVRFKLPVAKWQKIDELEREDEEPTRATYFEIENGKMNIWTEENNR